ncbi:MAG: OmpA family protein [Bacteroidia bacterium]
MYPTQLEKKITECYTNGDSLSTDYFKKCALSLLFDGKQIWKKEGDMHITSFEISLYDKGKLVFNPTHNSWTATIARLEKMPEKIVISRIKASQQTENKKIEIDISPVTFYRARGNSKKANNSNPATISYEGKILYDDASKEPLINQRVALKDDKNMEVEFSYTNKDGSFNFEDLNTDRSYKIVVSNNDKNKMNSVRGLVLAKEDGTVVSKLMVTDEGFSYELLPTELIRLEKEKAEDPELLLKKFENSAESEIVVLENIYYDKNSANFKSESVGKLDKIIKAMNQNESLNVRIYSHTDSQGDDSYNLRLSQNRALNVQEYFVANGINVHRITAIGMGETQILNRCKNNVDCSEEEHKVNRRTEFKFSKQ